MKKIIAIFVVMLLFPVGFSAFAQDISIKGQVKDKETGEALPGVAVMLKGSKKAVVSDLDGKYSILAPKDGVLEFVCLGYQQLSANIDGKKEINVALSTSNEFLNEVVVTAMGISRAEKSLGYSATTVKSDDIVGARTTNAAEALSGKVAGVQVLSTSSDPGAVSNVIIRGFSSINGSNQPLYVVDGVPLQSNSVLSNSEQKSSSISGINNISPEDIESMTVLKGAAATALYGSRAANGVIVVTTKSGKKGETRDFNLTYSGGVQFRSVCMLPEFQNTFGQGWNGTQTYIENGSWGPALDGSTQVYGPIWNNSQRIHTYDAKVNNVRDFFECGVSQNHNVAFSGMSHDNKVSYYLSYGYTGDNGVIPTDRDKFDRNTLAFRGSYEATKWLKLSSSVNFSRSKTSVVDAEQGATVIDGLLEFPRDISMVDLKDLSIAFNTPEAYLTPYGITNPYWALENNYDVTNSQQINGKIQVDVKPIPQLTVTYRYGFDFSNYDHKIGYPQIALDDALINDDKGYAPSKMNQNGYVVSSFGKIYETNNDILVNFTDKWGKFDFTAIAGLNINERGSSSMGGQTSTLTFNTGFWDLSNGADKTSLGEGASKRRLIGLFGDVTVGWNDEVYVDLTARNDRSSTLPINANSYFYPGVTGSWIFSRRINWAPLSFAKVRVAYGKTGNDAAPYKTTTLFTQAYANGIYSSAGINFPLNGQNAFVTAATKGNNALRPEMTSEFETGLNIQFFKGRLGLDAAYYNRTTKDQIFTLPVDPATGFNYMVTNFGSVKNHGVELLLTTTPVQTKDWRWDVNINFAKNNNKVLSLPEEIDGGKAQIEVFGAGGDAVYCYAEIGKPMGEFWTYLPQYNEKGQMIVTSDGQPKKSDNLVDTGKNFQADWSGGVSTSLSWKGITLSATLDVRKGGYMFSRTKNLMEFTGNGAITTYNSRNPFVIPNSVYEDGSPNTSPIYLYNSSYQTYFDSFGAGQCGEFYLVDRSFAKLRNVSLSWDLPKKWMNAIKFQGITVTAFCNNVFTWTAADNIYIDPETTTYNGDGDLAAQFGETYSNPSCRIFGFNFNIKF